MQSAVGALALFLRLSPADVDLAAVDDQAAVEVGGGGFGLSAGQILHEGASLGVDELERYNFAVCIALIAAIVSGAEGGGQECIVRQGS